MYSAKGSFSTAVILLSWIWSSFDELWIKFESTTLRVLFIMINLPLESATIKFISLSTLLFYIFTIVTDASND